METNVTVTVNRQSDCAAMVGEIMHKIFNWIQPKVQKLHDAEEISQDTLFEFYRSCCDPKRELVQSAFACCKKIAGYRVIDFYRRESGEAHRELDPELASINEKDHNFPDLRIDKLSGFLDPDEALVIVYRAANYTLEEIAERLEYGVKKITRILERACAKVKAEYGDTDE